MWTLEANRIFVSGLYRYIYTYVLRTYAYVCVYALVRPSAMYSYIYIHTYIHGYVHGMGSQWVCMYATVFDLHPISTDTYVPIHTAVRKNSQRLPTSEGRPKLGWHRKQLPLFTYKYLVMSNVPSYPGAVSYTLVTGFVYARPGHVGHLYKRKMTYTFLSPRRFLSHTL